MFNALTHTIELNIVPWIPKIEAKVAKGQQNSELDLICICHLGRLAKISQLWVTLRFR